MVKPSADAAAQLRSGQAIRSQRLGSASPLTLAGTQTLFSIDLGPDDGDVASQAVLGALVSACGLPGIDMLFPADDPQALRSNSLVLLSQTVTALRRRNLERVLSASVSLHLAPWRELSAQWQEMAGMLASALQVSVDAVGISLAAVPDGMDANCVYAFAGILCQRGSGAAQARPAGQPAEAPVQARPRQAPLLDDAGDFSSPASRSSDDDDEFLPQRAREFEQAVRSGLPPLPRGERPEPGSIVYVYSDGASRGNPGKAATGFVVMNSAGLLVHEGGSRLEDCTNNQAEYLAIIEALTWIEQNLGHDYQLECRLDSELVVKQLRGEYKVKHEDLKPLSMKAMNLLMFFTGFELRHVPRSENKRADALANEVLDRG